MFLFSWSLVSAGLHDATDDAEGQRSGKISGLLHSNPGHDVSPQSEPLRRSSIKGSVLLSYTLVSLLTPAVSTHTESFGFGAQVLSFLSL